LGIQIKNWESGYLSLFGKNVKVNKYQFNQQQPNLIDLTAGQLSISRAEAHQSESDCSISRAEAHQTAAAETKQSQQQQQTQQRGVTSVVLFLFLT
jgi:hypothetical protein